MYLNTDRPLKNYKELINEKYFVDKSLIIKLLNEKISTKSKYVCVTRPRRFGKSSVVDMLGAYYSKAVDLKNISARDTYRVEREEKTGKGYADFTFHPRRKNDIPFIVELKKDELPEVAIKQIIEKEYVEKFKKENEGKKVLAVAICYDSKKKEHRCQIKEIQE